tara:strand:+ start:2159 stop:3013 length:855 start_codon:yes stop_codon:yes gene_type:complete
LTPPALPRPPAWICALTTNFFENKDRCDFALTDVLFAFEELYDCINKPSINSILEIGSGTGILLNEFSKYFPSKKFIGLDPYESGFHNYEDITNELKKKDNLNFIKGHLKDFDKKLKFDLIFSFNVFEHVENQLDFVKISYDLLKDGGKKLIFFPNYDFPYEPHFVIPLIINKSITYKLFKNRIVKHEAITKEKGLWEGLNFNGKKKIEKMLHEQKIEFEFDETIKDKLFQRIKDDQSKYFRKRQNFVSNLALLSKKIYLDKLVFNFLKIPFPYLKLIIKKKYE